MAASLRPYLAEDLTDDVEDDYADKGDVDDAEVLVEVKTDRFLVALGVPPLRAAH